MVQTRPAKEITLYDLTEKFGLQFIKDSHFFSEWEQNLSPISKEEKEKLDRIQTNYYNLLNYPPLLEDIVKMAVLSPLLDLASFYLPPFHIKSEPPISISLEDEGVIIKGKIDILVICQQFWVLAIESKQAAFSLEVGRAQLLTYMLANPHPERPAYGLLTNGNSFVFVKLIQADIPPYSLSRFFHLLNPGNDLYQILQILKRLGELVVKM